MQTTANNLKQWVTTLRLLVALTPLGLVAAGAVAVVADLLVRVRAGAPLRADELLVGCAAALALVLRRGRRSVSSSSPSRPSPERWAAGPRRWPAS